MSINSKAFTNAGSVLAISATLPATHDSNGFSALSFTNIAEVVDLGNGGGRTYTVVNHSPLAKREVVRLKGSFQQGDRAIQLASDISDAGQTLLDDALKSDNLYSFSITFNNGDVYYFTAYNTGGDEQNGTSDAIVGLTATLTQCNDTMKVLVSGVLTASILAAGTFTGVTDAVGLVATQASVAPSGGTGAEFAVTLVGGTITAIVITKSGSGYAASDVITLSVAGTTESVAATITVDSVLAL